MYGMFLAHLWWRNSLACPHIHKDPSSSKLEYNLPPKLGIIIPNFFSFLSVPFWLVQLVYSLLLLFAENSISRIFFSYLISTRLLVKLPEVDYQLKVKTTFDKYLFDSFKKLIQLYCVSICQQYYSSITFTNIYICLCVCRDLPPGRV